MIVIYDLANGRIKRCCSAQGQAGAGEGELESDLPYGIDATHHVVGGTLVEKPAQPSEFHAWDHDGHTWVEDPDSARRHVRAEWNRHVAMQLAAGTVFSGWPAHSDDTFMGELQLLITALDKGVLTGPQAIRGKDNVTRMLTQPELEALALTAGAHRQAVYAASWAAKDQLGSKTAVAEILALLPV